MTRPLRTLAIGALVVAGLACSDEPGPADAAPDATFLFADATPTDTGLVIDAGGLDADVDDGATPDSGDLDAGEPDADPCAQAPVQTLSATSAGALASTLAGEVVALTGTATAAPLVCTDRACPEDDPCCNDCTARIRVGDVLLAPSACAPTAPGCAGNECNQTCRPPLFGLPQTFRGVLSTAAPDLELLLYEIR